MGNSRSDEIQRRKAVADEFLVAGEQADMFGSEGAVVPVGQRSGPGRPAGATNKLKSRISEYMALRGYRDPVEQLAMLAGLDRPDVHPLAYAAQIAKELGEDVMDVAKVMRQAASDLLPYYHAKITPDVSVNMPVMSITMAPQGTGPDGSDRPSGPPPMPSQANPQSEQYQELSQGQELPDATERRTE